MSAPMTRRKGKPPTKRQQEMAAMFKAGACVRDVAIEMTQWPSDPHGFVEVQSAIRAVMLWDDEAGKVAK